MIDIEVDVLNEVRIYLKQHENTVLPLQGVTVSGDAVRTPASFPFATVIEKDNSTTTSRRSTAREEDFADVLYEVNVYSNKQFGKKSECRTIASFIDEAMIRLGFSRISLEPMVNLDDASIYRMVGRYRASVSKDRVIYRR